MKISRAAWDRYISRLSELNGKAADQVLDWVVDYGLDDIEALIKYSYGVVTKYGEGAAVLSAQMYDAIAELEGSSLPPAEPAPTPEIDEVDEQVHRALRKYQNEKAVSKEIGNMVKRTGADTMLRNAIRDKAQFAWVPNGDTCAFCRMLASNGWRDASYAALHGNHAEHIHANCDCTYAIRTNSKTQIEGYDPRVYLDEYEAAEGKTWQEKLNSMRRDSYAKNKDKINAQKRAAYAERVGKSKGILVKDVTKDYFDKATPGEGKYYVPSGREIKNREESNMKMIYESFGGDIEALKEDVHEKGRKNPDYRWNGKFWEEQEPQKQTQNAIDKNVQEAIHQIAENPGGIVLDVGNSEMTKERILEIAMHRLSRSASFDCDLILIRNNKIEGVYRHKK